MTGTGKSCRRQASEHASRAKKFEAWPVSEASLDTLMDLGMTDDQIASYFKTTAEDVEKLTSGKRRRARGHVGGTGVRSPTNGGTSGSLLWRDEDRRRLAIARNLAVVGFEPTVRPAFRRLFGAPKNERSVSDVALHPACPGVERP